ncbi:MAG: aminotransferase class V-fold PLP-dependent enzyme [Opitutaceae bacterium]|nr:aminotransferase class V-fold PLP-dependent enzyme [Opitutaceae bacterium]
MERRSFVAALGGLPLALSAGAGGLARESSKSVVGLPAEQVAQDEEYWLGIRRAFGLDANHINLNSGSVSPAPRTVHEAMDRYWTATNMSPSYLVDEFINPGVEMVRRRLAAMLGCSTEELALTRNTSESLQIAQMGLTLERGDEVVSTTQDYSRMITAWRQRERRDGIVLKLVGFPTPPPSLDLLYDQVFSAVTSRTKAILISHMTYTTGQIFPVRKICEEARRRGIVSIVDGAHTFAHFPFTVADLGCDVFGSSLHKWLCAPIGTGLLYVRREVIPTLWPLMAAGEGMRDDIRKFEEIGTHPIALRAAISDAITFHEEIGGERKAARLQFLRARWMRALADVPGVRLLTNLDPAHACAIGSLALEGVDAREAVDKLQQRWGIHVRRRRVGKEQECIRVAPNIFTKLDEIDLFAEAIRTLAKQ